MSQYEPNSKVFDFAFEFQPNALNMPSMMSHPRTFVERLSRRIKKKIKIKVADLNYYIDYSVFMSRQIKNGFRENVYPGITPMWDNSARRRENPFILHNSTPEKYKIWLSHIKENYPWNSVPEHFLFINAWNEWAEGNHLEPCQEWGTAYLEVTKEVLK